MSDHNEDAYAAIQTTDGGDLLLVCDGMGGMGRGAEASSLAIEFLEDALVGGGPHSVLRAALSATDLHLRERLVDPGPGKPGCTAVAVTVRDGRAWVCWAGDARGYHIRAGEVIARTRDHKLVEDLIEHGHIKRADAQKSRMGHVVTRCLGGRRSDEDPFEPETVAEPWLLEPGDALLLCTDGLTDVLPDEDVGDQIAGRSADDAASHLVQRSLDAGTEDNVTVLVAIWDQDHATPARPHTPTVPAAPRRGATGTPPNGVPTPPRDPLLQVVDGGRPRQPTPEVPLVEAQRPADEVDPYLNEEAPRERRAEPALIVLGVAMGLGIVGAICFAIAQAWMSG